jgi:uncharacterized protein (DUF486 family)
MLLMHFVNHSKVFFFVFESTLLHQLKKPLIIAFQFMWVYLHSTAKILHPWRPAPHDLPQPCGTTPSKSILCSQPHPQPILCCLASFGTQVFHALMSPKLALHLSNRLWYDLLLVSQLCALIFFFVLTFFSYHSFWFVYGLGHQLWIAFVCVVGALSFGFF